MHKDSLVHCLIIDDDAFIQELLVDKLTTYFPQVKVIGLASSGKEGIEKIISLKPDLVFLDVEMGDMTGFEMLATLTKITFKTIFITSYEHYAIKAIRFSALDYLLKPFDLSELKNALQRFSKNSPDTIPVALSNLKTKNPADKTLVLKTQQGTLNLRLREIVYVSGERNYSNIHLTKGRKELVTKTLCDLEELLEDQDFFRCHKSYLVNKMHIISEPKAAEIHLSNNESIPISRRKKGIFNDWFHAQGH